MSPTSHFDMIVFIAGLFPLYMAAGGAIFWAASQKGRIDGHDSLFEEREKQDVSRDKRADERHEETRAWLARIEQKLDRVNGKA